ncbi:hypothetical protein G6F46_013917 [Rhizopus delemar]|nr:hypothetical protein G6F46_013917 [Rhizopus delemar]
MSRWYPSQVSRAGGVSPMLIGAMPGVASPSGRGSTASPTPSAHSLACVSRLLLRAPMVASGSRPVTQPTSAVHQ